MGLMLRDLKNHSKSVKSFRFKTEESWCLRNEHIFFFVLRPWPSGEFCFFCFVCTGPSMNPGGVQKKLHVHAPRDGTAAGRHGGAAREKKNHENCTLV